MSDSSEAELSSQNAAQDSSSNKATLKVEQRETSDSSSSANSVHLPISSQQETQDEDDEEGASSAINGERSRANSTSTLTPDAVNSDVNSKSSSKVVPSSPDNLTTEKTIKKRSKVSRACDECRRKKIKCDATFNSQTNQIADICHNCKKSGDVCTFTRIPLKRGPSKGSVSGISSSSMPQVNPQRSTLEEQQQQLQQNQQQQQQQFFSQSPRNSFSINKSPATPTTSSHILSNPVSNISQQQQQQSIPFQLPPLNQAQHSRILPPINSINHQIPPPPPPPSSSQSQQSQQQLIDDQNKSFMTFQLMRPRSSSVNSNVENSFPNPQHPSSPQPPIFWKVPMELPSFSSGTGISAPPPPSLGTPSNNGNQSLNFGSNNGGSISSTNNNSRRNSIDSISSSVSNSSNNTFSPSLSSTNLLNNVAAASTTTGNNRNSLSLNFGRSRAHSTTNSVYDNIGNSDSEDEFLNNNRRSTNITIPLTSSIGGGSATTATTVTPSGVPGNGGGTGIPGVSSASKIRRSSFGKEETVSPVNSVSSLHSLNQNLSRLNTANSITTNKSILLKNFELSLEFYYAKHNSTFPILPMNKEFLTRQIMKIMNKDELFSIVEIFNLVLQNLNSIDYPRYQINELLGIFNEITTIYNTKNYLLINDRSARFVFMTLLTLVNYIIVLSGQTYSLTFGFSFSFMNDWKLDQLFEKANNDPLMNAVGLEGVDSTSMEIDSLDSNDTLNDTESGERNATNSSPIAGLSMSTSEEYDYDLYMRRLYLSTLILDNIYSLSFGISSFNSTNFGKFKFRPSLYFTRKELEVDSKENSNIGVDNYELGFELMKYDHVMRSESEEAEKKYIGAMGQSRKVQVLLKQKEIFNFFLGDMKDHYLNNHYRFKSMKKEDEEEFYFEFQLRFSKLSKEVFSQLYDYINDPKLLNKSNDTILITPFVNLITVKSLKLISLMVFLIRNLIKLNSLLGNDDFKSRLNKIENDLTNLSNTLINEKKYPIGTIIELISSFERSFGQTRKRSASVFQGSLPSLGVSMLNDKFSSISKYIELCCFEITKEIENDSQNGWLYN